MFVPISTSTPCPESIHHVIVCATTRYPLIVVMCIAHLFQMLLSYTEIMQLSGEVGVVVNKCRKEIEEIIFIFIW